MIQLRDLCYKHALVPSTPSRKSLSPQGTHAQRQRKERRRSETFIELSNACLAAFLTGNDVTQTSGVALAPYGCSQSHGIKFRGQSGLDNCMLSSCLELCLVHVSLCCVFEQLQLCCESEGILLGILKFRNNSCGLVSLSLYQRCMLALTVTKLDHLSTQLLKLLRCCSHGCTSCISICTSCVHFQ
mmetsp:Transcript_35346/g.92786  ORF Transcript_35346/g.92786 Transcript_35346/m.92786 type:complete len:186 (+) Transcript_35346:607-1164(+)